MIIYKQIIKIKVQLYFYNYEMKMKLYKYETNVVIHNTTKLQ